MVELTLPKNSKVGEGKMWPKPAGAKELREYRIYRWNPDDGENPRVDTYYVDTARLRADGSRRADLDQEQDRSDA